MKNDYSDSVGEFGEPSPATEAGAGDERDLTDVMLPPFQIINSCTTLGFHKPLDCFWSEVKPESEFYLKEQFPCSCAEYRRIGSRWSGLRASATINVYIHRCLFNDKDSSSIYRMGQCPACNTIYWAPEQKAA